MLNKFYGQTFLRKVGFKTGVVIKEADRSESGLNYPGSDPRPLGLAIFGLFTGLQK